MRCETVRDLLPDYIDQRYADRPGSAEQHAAVSAHLEDCPECTAQFVQLNRWQQLAGNWKDEPVPDWHRPGLQVRQPARTHWLSFASMATAAAALLLVLFQVHFRVDDQGLHVAFGSDQASAQLQRQMDEFQLEQTAYLDARLLDLEQQNRGLLVAFFQSQQQQRQQDMGQLVNYWQSQRIYDQTLDQAKFGLLADKQQQSQRQLRQLLNTRYPETSTEEQL